jgi:hypothetical protein
MILIDAHVHIYDCFDLGAFFYSAYDNFQSAAVRLECKDDFTAVLLLTETAEDNWFQQLASSVCARNLSDCSQVGRWHVVPTEENSSIIINLEGNRRLLLIAGRQIATAEGLEVLALLTAEHFEENRPLKKIVEYISEAGGVPVIPWGFGKWLGKRGAIVDSFLRTADGLEFYLGDNGNRPGFFSKPRQFKIARRRGIGILPGSDPFPFVSEQRRAGGFGMIMNYQLSDQKPAYSLKMALKDKDEVFNPYGQLERPFRFFRNQIAIQIYKRLNG